MTVVPVLVIPRMGYLLAGEWHGRLSHGLNRRCDVGRRSLRIESFVLRMGLYVRMLPPDGAQVDKRVCSFHRCLGLFECL